MQKNDKCKKMKSLLSSPKTSYFMEAHNGISGKIVEKAGFDGVWGSSLTLSATLGMRDNNEVSSKEAIEMYDYINSSINIPMLVDIDTGYGNFNNARQAARNLEKIGIAGICMEDKLFPKLNSFIHSTDQKLSSIEEFCGKIRAVKDALFDDNFCVVARTEAFIVGHNVYDALERAYAYYEAGADAVFIHSKLSTPDNIISFMQHWTSPCPVIIAPTTYHSTPSHIFENLGIRTVIWANMMLRASIKNMLNVASIVKDEKSIDNVLDQLSTVQEIFDYQNMKELEEATKKYVNNGR